MACAPRTLAERGARIQVAEQYQFQPIHAARLAIARSGRLGTISQAQISAAHGYHGIDLIRRFLDDRVRAGDHPRAALRVDDRRRARPRRPAARRADRAIRAGHRQFDFDGRLGVYDFTDDQYFSWIRSHRVLVRGDRGEIHDTTVRYLEDATTPVTLELRRHAIGQDGDLSGLGFEGITAGPTGSSARSTPAPA